MVALIQFFVLASTTRRNSWGLVSDTDETDEEGMMYYYASDDSDVVESCITKVCAKKSEEGKIADEECVSGNRAYATLGVTVLRN